MLTKDKPSLTLKRQLKASPEKVFQAWSDPQKLRLWFGPGEDMSCPICEADVRIGGRYRIVMRTAGGEEHRVGGEHREVVPSQRLVFTWAWESTPERKSLVTVDIVPSDAGSTLTLKHEQFFDEPARDRHETGWSATLDKLERYLS